MSTPCSVCTHGESAAIDDLLRGGATARSVSAGYDLGYDAVARHKRNHVSSPATGGTPHHGTVDPVDELVAHLRRRALAGQDAAAREYRLILAQQAARNATAPPRDLATEPEWLALRVRILAALEPFPDARLAVADALVDL